MGVNLMCCSKQISKNLYGKYTGISVNKPINNQYLKYICALMFFYDKYTSSLSRQAEAQIIIQGDCYEKL